MNEIIIFFQNILILGSLIQDSINLSFFVLFKDFINTFVIRFFFFFKSCLYTYRLYLET